MTHSILDTIGNTPLVEIRHLNPNPSVKIMAKLEYFNPGGSVKDRPALYMIEAGEKSGELTRDKIVIEATSGNTGIGLALVCSVKGYRLLLTMSEAVSIERQKILKARGAEIRLTPGHLGTDGAIEEVYRLARENPDRYFMADQFNNPANWMAHYDGTAKEVWEQTEGEISMLVATLGTSGTLMGLSQRLKEYNPDVQIIGVEPYLGHKIQGLKNMKEAYRPEIFDKKRLDEKINIEDEEAYEMARQLARKEGLFVGMSSGAAMAVAIQKAKIMKQGMLVVIFSDNGERYLSTPLFTVEEEIGLKLFNTMTRRKEPFKPLVPGKASMYTCGPTANTRMPIGQCRRFVFSDILSRYLKFRGFDVNHVMNITDMDDTTIEGSEKAGKGLSEFTQGHIDVIKQDLEALGIAEASRYPLASEHVNDMVKLTEKLVEKGAAYEKLRSLYFDISRFSEYGSLSGIDLNKIRIGATVDLDDYEKDNPRDFTLLKRSKLSELKRGIFATTPWGNVRPSWHMQCTAMTMKYLGEQYDIEASGRELIFPHHENKIAIAKALTGKSPAKYWVHCERVQDLHDSKENREGNFTLENLINAGFSGKEIRYWLMSGHYRKPLTYSPSRLEDARRSLKRINICVNTLQNVDPQIDAYPDTNQIVYNVRNEFVAAMDDDLNVSAAMASIFRNIKIINTLCLQNLIDTHSAGLILDALKRIDSVLNVFDFTLPLEDPRVRQLIQKRKAARAEKNWVEADALREQIRALGVMVRDGKVD